MALVELIWIEIYSEHTDWLQRQPQYPLAYGTATYRLLIMKMIPSPSIFRNGHIRRGSASTNHEVVLWEQIVRFSV